MVTAVNSVAGVQTANTADLAVLLDLAGLEGVFYWTSGNFTGQVDNIDVIQSSSVSIATGAWVRQGAQGVTFEPNGVGVRRPAQEKMADIVSVRDFGATGDGTADDTTAILAALASFAGSGMLYFPAGTYRVTDTITIDRRGIKLKGAGREASVILFAPTQDATCIAFDCDPDIGYFQGMEDLTVTSNDNTYAKVLVDLVDVSGFVMERVNFTGGVSNEFTRYLFGGENGSIALRTNGRDTSSFRSIFISAQRPIVIAPNPNSTLACDHFNFNDLYLLGSFGTGEFATDYPLIDIQDGPPPGNYTGISNISFTGFQAWVGGGFGLYWADVSSSGVSNTVLIENVRREQQHNNDRHFVYVDRAATNLQGLTIRNCYIGQNVAVSVPGIYARRVTELLLEAVRYNGTDSGVYALDIDSTVFHTVAVGCAINQGAGISIPDQHKVKWGLAHPSAAAPGNFELQTTASVALRLTDVWETGETVTLADTATYVIGPNTLVGTLHISNQQGSSALFNLLGTNNLTQEVSDVSGQYSATAGASGTTNIFHSGGNYVLENRRGVQMKYRFIGMGPGSAGF